MKDVFSLSFFDYVLLFGGTTLITWWFFFRPLRKDLNKVSEALKKLIKTLSDS